MIGSYWVGISFPSLSSFAMLKQVSNINLVCVRAIAEFALAAAFKGPPIKLSIGSPENCCDIDNKFVSIIMRFEEVIKYVN